MKRQPKIPSNVLAKAKAAAHQAPPKKAPAPAERPRTRQQQATRNKLIAALKKLHPMD